MFILANTQAAAPAFVPELTLRLADDGAGLWRRVEAWASAAAPFPYWAFAWAGGLALARHILDHPGLVRRRRVLDLATGSGIVAVTAMLAGASSATASDVDPLALAAVRLNAAANGVAVAAVGDVLDGDGEGAGVVLAGDGFYSPELGERVMPLLERARRRGAAILVGDAEREYMPPHFPRERFRPVAVYDVPIAGTVDDEDVKRATIWAPGWSRSVPRPTGRR